LEDYEDADKNACRKRTDRFFANHWCRSGRKERSCVPMDSQYGTAVTFEGRLLA